MSRNRTLKLVAALGAAQPVALTPRLRGYSVHYRSGGENRCPGCAGTHWHVGCASAECAGCGTALPLAPERRA